MIDVDTADNCLGPFFGLFVSLDSVFGLMTFLTFLELFGHWAIAIAPAPDIPMTF